MTDKQTLVQYRLRQVEETILDAQKMLRAQVSARSIVNRAYYSMFYSLLALFINTSINLKTSKHSGVISIFDKEFIHSGKIHKMYSKHLHKMFEMRQEVDYRELVEFSKVEAKEALKIAEDFCGHMKSHIAKSNL